MQVRFAELDSPGGVDDLALDWESLGRLVRVRTLQAVALDFAARATTRGMATDDTTDATDRILE